MTVTTARPLLATALMLAIAGNATAASELPVIAPSAPTADPAIAPVTPAGSKSSSNQPGPTRANAAASLPELGQPADLIADRDTESHLGQAWLRQLRASTALWPDPLVRDYIEALSYRLALHTQLVDPQFTVVIIDDREVNAFAVPGGIVGVNTGLILTAESEDELAGVMAHELGHLSQRHFARSQEANKYNQWIALGGLLASIAAASAGGSSGGNLGMAVGMSAQAAAAQNQLRYSRAFEQEADRIGMQTLTQAGYDPRAMPNFFLRLERATRQLGYMPEFLLTHPLTTSRLSDLERRVNDWPRQLKIDDPEFRLIQVRLQVAYSTQLDEMIRAFQEALKSPNAPPASRLGLSLALLRNNQVDEAASALAPLLASDPSRLDYRITAIDIALARRDYAGALKLSEQAVALFPNQTSLLDRMTRAALPLNRTDHLRPLLDRAVREHANDPLLWRLLSDCAASQQDAQTVFRARAEILFLTNRQKPAEEQMKNALRMARDNYSLTAHLDQRLDEMRRLDAEFKR